MLIPSSPLDKLSIARKLLLDEFQEQIRSYQFNQNKYELKIDFKSKLTLYIRYNEFGEYGYNILFSKSKYDRIRFDNFDERWDVLTEPHHLHERGKLEAKDSSMIGDPQSDIPKLLDLLSKFV